MNWISVKDRLPSKYSYYLTENRNEKYVSRFAGYRILRFYPKDKKWSDGSFDLNFDEVTHWMPLPEPPKDELEKQPKCDE